MNRNVQAGQQKAPQFKTGIWTLGVLICFLQFHWSSNLHNLEKCHCSIAAGQQGGGGHGKVEPASHNKHKQHFRDSSVETDHSGIVYSPLCHSKLVGGSTKKIFWRSLVTWQLWIPLTLIVWIKSWSKLSIFHDIFFCHDMKMSKWSNNSCCGVKYCLISL